MLDSVFFRILLACLLGALIGAQRETIQQKNHIRDFAGFRTFTLVSLLGYLISYISYDILNDFLLIIVGVFCVFILSLVSYIFAVKQKNGDISAITEISFVLTFVIGSLIAFGLYQISIALAITITTILFLGNSFHKFAKSLKENEIFATLKFAIISLIILPLLPNKNYTLLDMPFLGELLNSQTLVSKDILLQLDVFNFYHIWLMVVFISGIAYVGYILMKTIGAEKGIIWTGFLGGFMSSTALTSSFAIESKKVNYLSAPLVVGTIIACSTMFFRILFEIGILNPNLLSETFLLLGVMGIAGFIGAIYIFKRSKLNHVKKFSLESPFTLGPALKFAFFFLVITFVSKLFTIYFGDKGIFLIAFLSGIADVDAITITLLNLSMAGSISSSSAATGIFIAAFANTIFKGGIAYFIGSKNFFKGILMVFSLIIISGLCSIFFLI
ncbi:MAG: MgtC/SapB family protein [Nanoarchaeota archaeon]|nr:MgtC/SapB family protein [Nanoarchaeota archaeon]